MRIILLLIALSMFSCKEQHKVFVDSEKSNDKYLFPESNEKLRKRYKEDFKTQYALDLYLSAYNKMNQKEFEEAIKIYKKALIAEPNNKRIFQNLGNAYSAIGKIDSAKNYTSQAIKIDSTFDIALNSYGLFLMKQDSFILADKYFTKAIEIDTYNDVYYLNKAINFGNQKYMWDSCCKYVELAEKYKSSMMLEFIKEVKEDYGCE